MRRLATAAAIAAACLTIPWIALTTEAATRTPPPPTTTTTTKPHPTPKTQTPPDPEALLADLIARHAALAEIFETWKQRWESNNPPETNDG